MSHGWNSTVLKSEAEVLSVLTELRGKRWLSRGHPQWYGDLVPSIDRDRLASLSRREKLSLERRSIDLFRSTVRFFAGSGERTALVDDIAVLMVLRHYRVPTRLLDWSVSPYVAAYFAVCYDDKKDGEIWSFDEPLYEKKGKKQWKEWPETTSDGSGSPDKFDAKLTAFTVKEPPDWFIAAFYPSGEFPRQNAQAGAYSMTARFARSHAEAIRKLLGNKARHHRYVVRGALKPKLLTILREDHGVWQGSLFPDSAGAAETAHEVFR